MISDWVACASLRNRCNVCSGLGSNENNSLRSCLCIHTNYFPVIASIKSRPIHIMDEIKENT